MDNLKLLGSYARGEIVLMDSISYAEYRDGVFAVSGSHGGRSSGVIAGARPLLGAVFNDAGIGKEKAGIAGLAALDKSGIVAFTVSSDTARIGDAEDTWENGVISAVNDAAQAAGFKPGMRANTAVLEWMSAN